jgi:arginyl-tRNA synthetase
MMDTLKQLLRSRLKDAFATVTGENVDPEVRRSQYADFQSDAALGLARRLRRNPREIAVAVAAAARLDDLCSVAEVSGPGFINLHIDDRVLGRMIAEMSGDDRLGIPSVEPQAVVIDYSSPNAAKEMHVGHLRSTIIGDAAVRLLEWLGYRVIRRNHIGDWGTPFGMLIEHLIDIGETEAVHELTSGDLDEFYKAARRQFDESPEFQERSRRRVVLLQSGDQITLRLWHLLVEQSKNYFMTVYERLGSRLTRADFVGESAYNNDLSAVVQELERSGLIRESNGALCVFPAGFSNRAGEPLPLIVRKSDGGFGYAATDLAAIRERTQVLQAQRLLYVVGLPQHQHFQMIFEVATEAGWLRAREQGEHIGFGSVLGPDGKMFRSRAGGTIKLLSLLDEAIRRASVLIEQKNPELDSDTRREIARAVGIGAIKYADLSTDRTKDYVFDFDRMLSFEGNTAPYLQYAYTRIQSIFRRRGVSLFSGRHTPEIRERAERALALEITGLGDVVAEVAISLEFHRLANYLYELATRFTAFYEQCQVLHEEESVQRSRLVLCDVTARVLAKGLDLLGIDVPNRM